MNYRKTEQIRLPPNPLSLSVFIVVYLWIKKTNNHTLLKKKHHPADTTHYEGSDSRVFLEVSQYTRGLC
jgi:hypothetical protein